MESRFVESPLGKVHAVVHGRGKDVVLIHGVTDNAATWLPLQKQITARTHAMDLPGHGKSSIPKVPLTISQTSEAMLAYCNGAGIETATLVGWSLGGTVALDFAVRWPERVSQLVLIGPAALEFPFPKALVPLCSRWQASLMWLVGYFRPAGRQAMRGSFARGFMIPNEVVDNYFRGWRRWGRAKYLSRLLRSLHFNGLDSRLPLIRTRVILVHGVQDWVIPIRVARELKALLPRAELRELEGCGHGPHIERPHETLKAIHDALRE